MDNREIQDLIETVETLKDCQIELDQVIDRIRMAVQGSSAESTADVYTLPGLMMISHEEGHGYLGRELGNLDALMRDINEVVEEQIALNEEADVVTQIEDAALGIDSTEIDESKQVKVHDQPDRVRDVLTDLTPDELTVLRIATRPFDGHPGVDSKTIVYYKPDFLCLALLKSVEDHVQTLDGGKGSKAMTSKGLTVTLDILEKFEKARFPGVSVGDLAHVEMETDDEKDREMAQEEATNG